MSQPTENKSPDAKIVSGEGDTKVMELTTTRNKADIDVGRISAALDPTQGKWPKEPTEAYTDDLSVAIWVCSGPGGCGVDTTASFYQCRNQQCKRNMNPDSKIFNRGHGPLGSFRNRRSQGRLPPPPTEAWEAYGKARENGDPPLLEAWKEIIAPTLPEGEEASRLIDESE